MQHEQLVLAAQRGDDTAFYHLISQVKIKLYKIAFAYLKNEQDALEAIQETTLRAYVNIRKLKNPQYYETWLIRILINYCNDELSRKNRFSTKPLRENSLDTTIDENMLDIKLALDKLEPKYRQIIILKYFEDLTISDISDVLDRPEGTVKTWLNQALRHLRSLMIGKGEHYV